MKNLSRLLLAGAVAVAAAASCVGTTGEIGKGLIDNSLLFDTYTVEFPLEEIRMERAEQLSGFSSTRVALGAIRDDVFGLTTRSSAFTLVPALDTIDLGKDPVAVKFDLHLISDSVSVASSKDAHILQNLFCYALTDTLSTVETGTNRDIPHGTQRITKGIPVLNGKDSLSLEFTQAFAQKYVDAIQEVAGNDHILCARVEDEDGNKTVTVNKYKELMAKVPGIYLECGEPEGNGGRINLFKLSCLSVASASTYSYYYRNENVARLVINAEYNGVRKDTAFLFIPGEPAFYDEASLMEDGQAFYQYAFNRTSHETVSGPAGKSLWVEGGGGLKPVISASEIQNKTLKAIAEVGGDPAKAVINKATITLPFEMPAEYTELDLFPGMLSPTIKVTDEETGRVSFGGLTDASASTENQGDIDRANLVYAPDITFHVQEFLKEDLSGKDNRDVWLLTVHTETKEVASGNSETSQLLQAMMYSSYYNNLYGGGYGYGYGSYGYGGYGGYGGYSNYYNYAAMMAMMSSQSQNTTQSVTELDKDRYYLGRLNGPLAAGKRPFFRITFSIPKG